MNDNVIHLNFHARVVETPLVDAAPFILEAGDGKWTIRGEGNLMTPAELMAAADILREIARDLTERAPAAAGFLPNRCVAEFVLHENGGIDHWVSPNIRTATDRMRLKMGLRNAIASIRNR